MAETAKGRLLPQHAAKPAVGMTVAFTAEASAELADIPARVIAVWPRFRSGAYLVTLEYAQPIAWHHEVIQQIEAFMSELYQPPRGALASARQTTHRALCDR